MSPWKTHLFFPFLSQKRETNLKVRQALTVTSGLGDITKLMNFDGEMMLDIFVFICGHLRLSVCVQNVSPQNDY